MKTYFVLFLLVLIALSGCVTTAELTEGGKSVEYVTKVEAAAGCTELGDVYIKHAMDMMDLRNQMRNKAAEMGADLLVIEVVDKEPSMTGIGYLFNGTGRAYKCKK